MDHPPSDDPVIQDLLHKDIDVPLPPILRFARRTYTMAIRDALREHGFTDIPKNGMYIIGGIARMGSRHGDVVRELALTKQAASQLVDVLVEREYLVRTTDENDRRRVHLELTDRGREAAKVSRSVAEEIEDKLLHEVGIENFMITKRTLAVLIDINDRRYGLPRG